MRNARIEDHKRHVFQKEIPNRVLNFSHSVPGKLTIEPIIFDIGINALVGRNGSGKTTIIKNIFSALKTLLNQEPERVKEYFTYGIVRQNGHEKSFLISDHVPHCNNNFEPGNVIYLDSANESLGIQNFFNVFNPEDLQEILETQEEVLLKPNEIQEITQIVGKTYSSISFYEISDEFNKPGDSAPSTIPYFKVTNEYGATYFSPQMGQGEFFIFYIWWMFSRQIERNSFVLMEEPENLLFPGAQKQLFYFLLKKSDKDKLSIILSTHSEHLLKEIPNTHIQIIRWEKDSIKNSNVTHDHFYLHQLGLDISISKYIFVEDESAKKFCYEIISRRHAELLHDIQIVPIPGGGDAIIELIKKIKGSILEKNYLGVLDKDKFLEKIESNKNLRLISIPGEKDPDTDLKKSANNKTDEFIEILDFDKDRMKTILDVHKTDDAHEWIHNVQRSSNLSFHRIFDAALSLFISETGRESEIEQFIKNLVHFQKEH